MYNVYTSDQGFFSRNAVWGWEIVFVGRENRKNIQKQTKFVIVFKTWGGGGGGGGISPLKALEKKITVPSEKKKVLCNYWGEPERAPH